MDAEDVRALVLGLTSGDRDVQRRIVQSRVAEDVTFNHILGRADGRDAFYYVYRLAGTCLDYQVWRPGGCWRCTAPTQITFHDMVQAGDRWVLVLDLVVKTAPFFLLRYHIPCISLLRFRPNPSDPKAPPQLAEQVDHHSLFAVMYLLGSPFSDVAYYFVQPLQGHFIVFAGWMIDRLSALREQVMHAWAAVPGASAAASLGERGGRSAHAGSSVSSGCMRAGGADGGAPSRSG